MQIVKIGDCKVRENPNSDIMNEGKEYVNVVFETEQSSKLLVDLAYTMDGMLRIHVLPILSNNQKSYDKIIEIKLSDGKTILDKLSVHN